MTAAEVKGLYTTQQVYYLCSQKDHLEALELNVQDDHVHLVLSIAPKYSVSSIIGYLKGKLPQKLFRQYKQLGSPMLVVVDLVVRKDTDPGENLLPSCHRVASLLKRWLMGTHQGAVSHEHLDCYLDEFTFRFNRRTSRHRGKLFFRFLQNAVEVDPVTFRQ